MRLTNYERTLYQLKDPMGVLSYNWEIELMNIIDNEYFVIRNNTKIFTRKIFKEEWPGGTFLYIKMNNKKIYMDDFMKY